LYYIDTSHEKFHTLKQAPWISNKAFARLQFWVSSTS